MRPFALFAAKLLVVVKLMCFTQCFVFVLYVACGRLFAGFSDWPPVSIVFYLVRGIFGGLAVAAVQLLLAMLIRSFAVPIYLLQMHSLFYQDRKSTRLNSSHTDSSRMPSSA